MGQRSSTSRITASAEHLIFDFAVPYRVASVLVAQDELAHTRQAPDAWPPRRRVDSAHKMERKRVFLMPASAFSQQASFPRRLDELKIGRPRVLERLVTMPEGELGGASVTTIGPAKRAMT